MYAVPGVQVHVRERPSEKEQKNGNIHNCSGMIGRYLSVELLLKKGKLLENYAFGDYVPNEG